MLWFCCDGGLFNKNRADDEHEVKSSLSSLYEDLNLQELDHGDPKIKQVIYNKNMIEVKKINVAFPQTTHRTFVKVPKMNTIRMTIT